jgi:hypothetical protein
MLIHVEQQIPAGTGRQVFLKSNVHLRYLVLRKIYLVTRRTDKWLAIAERCRAAYDMGAISCRFSAFSANNGNTNTSIGHYAFPLLLFSGSP